MAGWTSAIVMLAGPIKHWWDENWGTPAHLHYVAWRDAVDEAFVKAGYLVYRPHQAFKGAWDERAQSVNDMALCVSDVVINLTPPGVPSEGTDGEVLYAINHGTIIVDAPPTDDIDEGIRLLLERLDALGVRRAAVMQEKVVDSIAITPERVWMIPALLAEFSDRMLRVHYQDSSGHVHVDETVGTIRVEWKLVLKVEILH